MRKRNVQLTQIAMLIALQIILTVTPLGFLTIGVMTVTLMHIPVIIGAIVVGPRAGAILGFVFGVSSIISATRIGTPDVMVFTPFLSGSLWSVVVAIVPRVLMGIITAYLFMMLENTTIDIRVSSGIAAFVGALLNTVLTLGAVYFLLGEMYAELLNMAYSTLLGAFALVAVTNGTLEAIVAVLVAVVLVRPLRNLQHM